MNEFIKTNDLIRERIKTTAKENGLSDKVQTVLANLFDYMVRKPIFGGSHALSSVLYVALCELYELPELCIGECFNPRANFFDNSWVLLDGKIIDMAVCMPLSAAQNGMSGVVVMDIDVTTGMKPVTQYGCKSGARFGYDTQMAINTPFSEYMTACPYERNGLWSVVELILPYDVRFNIDKAKSKYADTKRSIKAVPIQDLNVQDLYDRLYKGLK